MGEKPAEGDSRAGATSLVEGLRRYEAGDYAGAMEQWRPLAQIGNGDALFNLGQLYRLGQGVAVDLAMAESFYAQAAKAGHVTAEANLATIYYFNAATRERRGQAIRLWRSAASHGDAPSQYMMAVLHFNGEGVPQDLVQAYAWLLLSIEQGFDEARAAEPTIRPTLTGNELNQAQLLMTGLLAPPAATITLPLPKEVGREKADTEEADTEEGETEPEPEADNPVPPEESQAEEPQAEEAASPVAPADSANSPVSESTPVAPDRGDYRSLAGRWSVQLGFFREVANARTHRRDVERRAGEIVGGLWWDLQDIRPRDDGSTFTKLLIGPFNGQIAASGFCDAVKARGLDCFVVAP